MQRTAPLTRYYKWVALPLSLRCLEQGPRGGAVAIQSTVKVRTTRLKKRSPPPYRPDGRGIPHGADESHVWQHNCRWPDPEPPGCQP